MIHRTLLPTAALVAATAVAIAMAPAPASAAGGACPTLDDGVTVVVDFQHLGGGTVTRCAPGDPDTGLAALAAAGFRVDQVSNQPGFVCRIDGLPGAESEDCADTPPAGAYWGYSHAERGGSWSYSGSGAHVYDPPVGSVEGWAFNGDGGSTQPTVPPPPRPEPEPSPSPSAAPSPTSSPDPRSPTGAAAASKESESASESDEPDPTTNDPVTPGTIRSSPSPAPTPTDRATTAPIASPDATTPPADPDTAPVAAPPPGDAGTPWPTLVGIALIGALLAAAAVLRNRRGPS